MPYKRCGRVCSACGGKICHGSGAGVEACPQPTALHGCAASLAEAEADDAGQGLPAMWAAAFSSGVAAMQRYGGAQSGDRTMLDALLPAAEAMHGGLQSGQTAGCLPPLFASTCGGSSIMRPQSSMRILN